ncbi:uncharacterized protein, partial [Cherax quadricarinatus]|uniref:uncharacterized protein n=1 Tax=Cherax quadricarinatus TaxID=27406 RepID=UPI00387EB3EA
MYRQEQVLGTDDLVKYRHGHVLGTDDLFVYRQEQVLGTDDMVVYRQEQVLGTDNLVKYRQEQVLGGMGVQVLELQQDGVASVYTAGVYQGRLDRNWKLNSVTLCARFNIFFLHQSATFFQLMDTVEKLDSQLKGELWLNRVRPVIGQHWQYHILKNKLRTHRWYHLCVTYDHLKHLYNTFINGELVYELTHKFQYQIYGDYARVGQSGALHESYSGALSQVNVWDSVLSESVIAGMAACRSDPQGNYVSWEAGWDLYNITEYQVSLEYFCHQKTDAIYFTFPVTVGPAFYICEALGTHLPLPTTWNQIKFLVNTTVQRYRGQGDICKNALWSPVTDIDIEGTWVTHYDNALAAPLIWSDGEPNGIFYENCIKIESKGLSDIDCIHYAICALCEFSDLPIMSLLGTCELEDRNVYFIAYQENVGDLYFKGYGEYHIRKVGKDWLWINVVTNKTLARLDPNAPFGMPMGRRVWHLETTVCDQTEGSRTFVLTPCNTNSYTCDDATCIPHENRCDLKYDCLDRSDEADCELVRQPADYRNDLSPRLNSNKNDSSLPITLHINIESVTVYTTEMTMQLSYEIDMVWVDNRLDYRNLKVNDSLNRVTYTTMMGLWSPTVGFVNTEGHQHTEVDIESSLYLQRLQPPDERDYSAPGE